MTEKDCNRITQIIPGKSLNHGKVCSLTGGSHTFSPFTYSISNAKKSCLSTSQNPTFRWNPLLRPQLEIYVINSFNLTRKICLDAIGKRFSRFNLPYWGIFFSFPFENFFLLSFPSSCLHSWIFDKGGKMRWNSILCLTSVR